MRILLVEDDRDVAEYIQRCLDEENHKVMVAFDGDSGLRAALAGTVDIIILDLMLPKYDGIEVTRRLRAARMDTPILLLTARDAPQDIVAGFEAGADDYLAKPFSFNVLLARLRARTRSRARTETDRLRFTDLFLDLGTHRVTRGDVSLGLTPTEFAILECLMRAAPRVVTRQALYDNVWGSDRDVCQNNVDVFMRLLRTKVDLPGHPRLIQTIRGIGFCLRERER
jgi:DNA-binding response OmpR family regulator